VALIQFKRRLNGTGKPASGTGAGQVTAGEPAITVSTTGTTTEVNRANLYVGDGAHVHELVSPVRQVELVGAQTITGNKTIDVTHLFIPGGDDGDLLSLADDTTGELEWVEPPKGVETGTTPPASPDTGDLFFNTTNRRLLIYNGTTWEVVNGVIIDDTAPTGQPEGTLWLNEDTNVLSVYDGTTWISTTGARVHWVAPGPPTGDHVAGDIWWSPGGPQYWNGTAWTLATLPGFAGVATQAPITGDGQVATPLGVTPATTAQIEADPVTNNVNPITPVGLRHELGAPASDLDTTATTIVPAINELVASIAAVSGAVRFVGTYNATTNQVATAAAGTLTVGAALPAAATANEGWYVILSVAGTGTAPAPAVALAVGDWIVSNGTNWVHVPLYHAQVAAVNVSVDTTDLDAGWTNVQLALEGLYDDMIDLTMFDGVSIIGDGTAADLLRVGVVDGGVF
jgi:hypothetical protein